MIKRTLDWIRLQYWNSNLERKRRFLISQGAQIGEGTRILSSISSFSTEPYLISIGKNTLLSSNVLLTPHDGGIKVLDDYDKCIEDGGKSYFTEPHDKMGRIKIGDNCFIGHSAIVLPGVTIGNNVIIGAGSIVSHDVPSDCVAAGVPARVICTLDEYYEKNLKKGKFYPTAGLKSNERKDFLKHNVK